MRSHSALAAFVFLGLLTTQTTAAEPAKAVPVRQGSELVLFDAGKHGLDVIRNYTASWKKGSNLVPVARLVEKDGERLIEISYTNDRGSALSLVAFENVPQPAPGSRYAGVKLTIDYDGNDYSCLSVQASFSDKTLVTKRLALERGMNEYIVNRGFRRAKFPPDWNRLIWVRLAVNTSERGYSKGLVFRLRKITMVEEPIEQLPAKRTAFGDRVLSPQPKQVDWRSGSLPARAQTALAIPKSASARTVRTAELFRQKLGQHTGTELTLTRFEAALPAQGFVLRLAPAVTLGGKSVALKPEGYALVVEPERVLITGADEPGLFYGGLTFLQLLNSSMRLEAALPVPCVEILDWPDMRHRLCRLEHPHHFRNRALKENRGIDFLIDWTDRFVAGNKLNVFFIDLSACTVFERRPEFNGCERIYTLADLRRFGQYCRDHFIDLCPAWQIGGHANWWLTIGYHPELRETGWVSQGDVTHPQHDAIVYDCMLDTIQALQPKYVSPKSDEWWHKRASQEPLAPLLHGKTRAQAFLDFHLGLHRWLKPKGIGMMLYHDMLTPYHNGKRFDVYKTIESLPKDVIVLHWSSPDDIPKWFAKHGLTVWMNPTGMNLIPKGMESLVSGYGKGMYSFGDSKQMPSELKNTSNMYAFFRAADHAWNLARDQRDSWEDQVASGHLVAVRSLFAVRPNARGGERARPLDVRADMNRSFSDFLKEARPQAYSGHERPVALPGGLRDIGFVPTQFAPEDGDNCLVISKGQSPVSLPVQGHFASLVFLHTARLNSRAGIVPTTYREWPYGFPCGDYIVHFEDGQQLTLPLRFAYNIRRFDVPAGQPGDERQPLRLFAQGCRGRGGPSLPMGVGQSLPAQEGRCRRRPS